MAIWDDVIQGEDREVFEKCGYGMKLQLGKKPALLIIDVTYAFVGDIPEPITKSVERFPASSGERGWKSVYKIQELLDVAREKKIPVIYSCGTDTSDEHDLAKWTRKSRRTDEAGYRDIQGEQGIVKEIAPKAGEIIIKKNTPSVFVGTPLLGYLINLGVDTVVTTGCTTSGCVRASVVDAFSYNFRVGIVEECVFDRFMVSHKVNLFDMNAKYAQVMSLAEAKGYLSSP